MINTYIGIGKSNDVQTAVEEATKGLINPKLIILISPFNKFNEATQLLGKKYATSTIIGTTGVSFANHEIVTDNLVILSIIDGIDVESGILANVNTYPISSIKSLEYNISKLSAGNNNSVCLEFCTGSEEMLTSTLSSALCSYNIPIVGGTASDCSPSGEKYVSLNGKLYKNSCAYVLIKNLTGQIKVYKENIYKPTEHEFTATKVDVKNRAILELDGKPASNVYSKVLNINEDEIGNCSFENPLGRILGKEVFITAIKGKGKNSSLECYKKINVNDRINILAIDNYDLIIENTLQQIQRDIPKPSIMFSVNCANRFALFQSKHYTKKHLEKMASICDHIGVVAEGEQFINQHVNQTMLCIVFE